MGRNEKLVKFNNVPLSPSTGFKNLVFETSRYSNGINTIRGFGETLSEANLKNIENVMIEFYLKAEELFDLAYIYSLFRALGVLTLENQYLLEKIGTSLTNGIDIFRINLESEKYKEEAKILKNKWIKKDIKYLCVFLENMRIQTVNNTSDGYKVSMVLSLYKNGLSESDFQEYLETFKNWKEKTNFDEIKGQITEYINDLKNTDIGLDFNYYNSSGLNALYKNNIISSSFKSFLLSKTDNLENKVIKDDISDNKEIDSIRNFLGVYDDSDIKEVEHFEKIKKTISIPNRNITQLELITHNNIAHIPIKGSPIEEKSILGIGKTSFTIQMIFDEDDRDIVSQLKTISDLNITDTKLEIDHPLIKLFDFYSGQIVNIQFNNIEEANGIIVTIVCNINGYRYVDETVINNSDEFGKVVVETKNKPKKLAGSYLEILNTYMFNKYRELNKESISPFVKNIITTSFSDYFGNYNERTDLTFFDLFSAYSTLLTNDILFEKKLNFVNGAYEKIDFEIDNLKGLYLNAKYNSELLINYISYQSYIVGNIHKIKTNKLSDLNAFDSLFEVFELSLDFTYMISSDKSLLEKFNHFKNSKINKFFVEKIARPISREIYNEKVNSFSIRNSILQKVYEEYLIRLDQVLYFNDGITDFKELKRTFNFSFIEYKKIFDTISNFTSKINNSFTLILSNRLFLNRIKEEIFNNLVFINKLEKDKKSGFNLEFEHEIEIIKREIERNWETKKNEIIENIYNIFLIKLTYYNFSYIYNEEKNKKQYNQHNNIVKMAISSCLLAPFLIKTKDRTDTIGLTSNYIFRVLGEAISNYNLKIGIPTESENEFEEKLKRTDKLFWETELRQNLYIDNLPNGVFDYYYNDRNFYLKYLKNYGKYFSETEFNDLNFSVSNFSKDNIRKDINYFYGVPIEKISFYSLISNFFIEKEIKEPTANIESFISEKRKAFLDEYLYCEVETLEENNFNIFDSSKLKVGNIFTPSYFPENYTLETDVEVIDDEDGRKNFKKIKLINPVMKNRIIGNLDPFKEILNISNLIKNNSDTIFPDYFILISLNKEKEEVSSSEYTYLQVKNLSSMSISKNPKTKIKTAIFSVANSNKNFFNINTSDGSFSIKDMKEGDIRSQIVKPGMEIRISLGYTLENSYTLFNGFVSSISEVGNTVNFMCSNFASTLYNFIPNNLKADNYDFIIPEGTKSNNNGPKGVLSQRGVDTATVNIDKPEITYEKNPFYQIILNSKIGINNLNSHLFGGFNSYLSQSKTTLINVSSSAFSFVTDHMMLKMPSNISKYFNSAFRESSLNENGNYLSTVFSLKNSLYKSFGTTGDVSNLSNTIHNLKNIFSVDLDYETYGLILKNSTNEVLYLHNNGVTYKPQYGSKNFRVYDEPEWIKEFDSNLKDEKNNSIIETLDSSKRSDGKFNYMTFPVNMNFFNMPSAKPFFQLFNTKKDGLYKNNRLHQGIDLSRNSEGRKYKELKVYAVESGTVTIARYFKYLGYAVEILHDDGITYTLYAHLDSKYKTQEKISSGIDSNGSYSLYGIKKGVRVQKGQVIGLVGNSGASQGVHLHFEVGFNNVKIASSVIDGHTTNYRKGYFEAKKRLGGYFGSVYQIDPLLYLDESPQLGIFKTLISENSK